MSRTLPSMLNAFPRGRLVAACLAAILAAPLSPAFALPPPQATAPRQLPDAPAAQTPPAQNLSAVQVAGLAAPPAPQSVSSGQSMRTQDPDQQSQEQNPVGTAAAPYGHPTGVAGSRPAGAAIAPAKQRRVRAFFIKASIIVAAAGAAGAVIALSHASSSRP